MRILVFLKQIPAFDQIEFDARGLLNRAEPSREMNPFCRRAVAKATTLVEEHGGEIVLITMGPPHASEVLREAIAWADARSVTAHGLHLCDPEFAGSDLAATGQALSAAVATLEPWDLVLCGARSVDAGTAMIPALLGAIFDVRVIEWAESLELNDSEWTIRVEDSLEMERLRRTDRLVVSCAERICDPCKVGTDQASSVATERIRTMTAKDLGLAEPMTPAVRTRRQHF